MTPPRIVEWLYWAVTYTYIPGSYSEWEWKWFAGVKLVSGSWCMKASHITSTLLWQSDVVTPSLAIRIRNISMVLWSGKLPSGFHSFSYSGHLIGNEKTSITPPAYSFRSKMDTSPARSGVFSSWYQYRIFFARATFDQTQQFLHIYISLPELKLLAATGNVLMQFWIYSQQQWRFLQPFRIRFLTIERHIWVIDRCCTNSW